MKKKLLIHLFVAISFTALAQKQTTITILHTNDTHSRIEPLPTSSKFDSETGGVVRRMNYVEQERRKSNNVLLLDAGDFLQGTPYFNRFGGEVEIETMNLLKYDAVTLGNHEFDRGIDHLANLLKKATFPIVNCNYGFEGTPLEKLVKPYVVIEKEGVRVGILGVGVNPKGLIMTENYKGMTFKPIVPSVNRYANILRDKEKCDVIICLSHIGYSAPYPKLITDVKLAEQSRNVDIIIGGHSHTYLKNTILRKNIDNKDVVIYQMGKNGSFVGKIEVLLNGQPKTNK